MKPWIKGVALICALALRISAQAHGVGDEMAEAARNFLATLSDEQKGKALFELKNDERLNWHFIPKERKGLPIKEMSSEQRVLANALLSSGLSHRGFFKASTIMSLEQILRDMEKGKGPVRDPERYFFSIFGQPQSHGTWGWRVEGHHLSLNFTLSGDDISVTPSFMGTNPGEVREGPRQGLRVLGVEEDLARTLVKSLDGEQKKVAIYTNRAPSEIITAADRKAHLLDPKGISLAKMNDAQKQMLLEVIKEYVNRARPEVADKEFNEIRGGSLDQIYFAWAGSTERGQGHYYRVQGPTFLLEYDNTQNNANHVHAVWRDLKDDFGEDILRKHYDESHHEK
ncbi:MAG TPA: DUF3500 domain-containing protein [Verrucomicrobiae bacterium]|nr:DUF3500 domain-containing protein [Verrucomicrobiae bacterium]